MNYYVATFQQKNPDKNEYVTVGRICVSDANTSLQFPIVAKAFKQAPNPQSRYASRVTFDRVKHFVEFRNK